MTLNYISRELFVELSTGKEVTTEVTVAGYYDGGYGADIDGNRGIGAWFIDDYEFDTPDACDKQTLLSKEEKEEFYFKILSKIDQELWDFAAIDDDRYIQFKETQAEGE